MMLLDVLSEVLLTPTLRLRGNIDPSKNVVNARKTSKKTLSADVKGGGFLALVLAVVCMASDSVAQTTKESIDVPPHSRLLLRPLEVAIKFTAASMAVGY